MGKNLVVSHLNQLQMYGVESVGKSTVFRSTITPLVVGIKGLSFKNCLMKMMLRYGPR